MSVCVAASCRPHAQTASTTGHSILHTALPPHISIQQPSNQALLARILALQPEQFPAFVEAERESLTTAFLSFVSSQGSGRHHPGSLSSSTTTTSSSNSKEGRKGLSELAATLTALKEAADWEASKRVLPPLAASLAYSNFAAWRRDHPGAEFEEVAPGVSLEDVYRAGEREVGER